MGILIVENIFILYYFVVDYMDYRFFRFGTYIAD